VEKVLHVVNKKEVQNDYVFWKQKSAQERISAIEILRLQYIQMQKDVQLRVKRAYKIVKRK